MALPLPSGILLEAEEFHDYGGWVLDSQFELEMGSPYLLAHGNGVPVANARTTVSVTDEGDYNVWVRAKDWVPGYHPGRFHVKLNGSVLEKEFGANDEDWGWEFGGKAKLSKGEVNVELHDLTGFCGRCDAIFFTREDGSPPNDSNESAYVWRKRLRGLPDEPVDAGHFDVVVLGGGVVGSTAALVAARLGDRVALVHNRPFLGGNASVEIGLRPRGVTGPLIDEISERTPDGDIVAKQLLDTELKAKVYLEHTVYASKISNNTIISIDARNARTGRELRFTAPIFIDCSGRALMGDFAGATTLHGQESQSEYNEPLAPNEREESHHGNTVFFRTRMGSSPISFPSVPWATAVSKDFSNLGGQLTKPGVENGPGPIVGTLDPKLRRRMKGPLTHFWEYGQWLDPYKEGERIRDYLLRAIYGTFSNVKTQSPEEHANLVLDHVAFVAAQGEFKRYKGAYVLSETDIRSHTSFPDAVARNGGAFCLHYPPAPDAKYAFRLKYWEWDERDNKDYDIPFRSLYSCNVENLMMSGKHISVTHVAGSNTKFMGNGGQHAIATAVAAHMCKKYGVSPRIVGEKYVEELKGLARKIAEENRYPGRPQEVDSSKPKL